MRFLIFLSLLIFVAYVSATPRWAVDLKKGADAVKFAIKHELRYVEKVGKYYIFTGEMKLKKLNLLQKLNNINAIKQVSRKKTLKKELNSNFIFIK